jgi:CheY-like chemotaxis protein
MGKFSSASYIRSLQMFLFLLADIVVVSRVNRMVTRGLLMRLGCEVTVVGSGRECLQVISQPGQSFQVLLLDVCMPDMDGYEVAIRIQEKFARHERPLLVALTANTDMATRERCLSLGMDRVILKPISLEKMRIVLTELLDVGSVNDNHWRARGKWKGGKLIWEVVRELA